MTLLFAHGGGFCRETWEPIICRLREPPQLSTAAIECVAFNFKYHGGRRDETVAPVIDRSNPASVRVHHPAQDLVSWVSADAWEQVQALRAKSKAKAPLESQPKLIGVGHSMGPWGLSLFGRRRLITPGLSMDSCYLSPATGARSREARR